MARSLPTPPHDASVPPASPAAAPPISSEPRPEGILNHAPAQILIVEDHPLLGRTMQRVLRRAGLEVLVAATGAEALDILGREPIQLLLLDRELPDADGFELGQRIRASPRFRALPIIFCTSCDTEADYAQARRLGACDLIAKPFSLTVLMQCVFRFLPPAATVRPTS